ncbi:MAG: ammonium transporter [Rhodospirillales bacterium]|mgnify:CR=1 FL=1|jgi:Amt family ammonium transporter|nr:ammonia channel protein [Rhodospirillaceae bacterium]MDP6428379.1 ammonium transporter [Rhodospirillales bacterium]MDP6642859.1 ammonium transporter [Rhodospirillales bacterium]MDP6842988.1 ammonium transporter [Rhodospirillales bacterium]
MKKFIYPITAVAAAASAAALAFADPALAAEAKPKLDTGDTAWMLTSTAIVLLMTIPGVALFYAGMVRKKNVLSMMMQCFAITCLVSIIWMVIGYSLAFSKGESSLLGNTDLAFLDHLTVAGINGTIPDSVFVIFQMTFAIITAALITGAVAERMKFSALLWFIGIWSVVVYSPITFWVWGGGFLGDAGVLDFAGGTVVHINSGVAALVAALMLGKRKGYGVENLAPHNLVLSVIGASLLWVGWFGFNAGSAVGANGTAGMAMAVTQIATAAAALAWMFMEWVAHKKPTVLGIVSGAIAGLVAITPASGFVGPKGALAIGIAAGLVCYWGAAWLKPKLGYDDSLDVFAVHGLGGITGAILTGVFAIEAIGGTAGALEGNIAQIGTQLWGIAATIIWSGGASAVILFIIDKTLGLRISEEAEAEGIDFSQHGEMVR